MHSQRMEYVACICLLFPTDLYFQLHELGYGLRHIKHICNVMQKMDRVLDGNG